MYVYVYVRMYINHVHLHVLYNTYLCLYVRRSLSFPLMVQDGLDLQDECERQNKRFLVCMCTYVCVHLTCMYCTCVHCVYV